MVDYTKPIAESNNFIVLDKYSKEWKVAENGFVAQTRLSLRSPKPQADLPHAHRHRRAQPGETIQQRRPHLQLRNLTIKVPRHHPLAQ